PIIQADSTHSSLNLPKVSLSFALDQLLQKTYPLRSMVLSAILKIPLQDLSAQLARWEAWDASIRRCKSSLLEEVGVFKIEKEPVYEKLLRPLWDIYRPVFDRIAKEDVSLQNMDLHKSVLFQNVLDVHGS